jgi:RND family efflux transporter MFP subunit
MLRRTFIVLCSALVLTGCGSKGAEAEKKNSSAAAEHTMLLSSEDVVVVSNDARSSGVVITGSVEPERRADLRAEVSSFVLQVLKENGEKVKKGDLLIRLDDSSVRENLTSSEESVRALTQARDQSERQFMRLKKLLGENLASKQEVEDAEIRYHSARSDLVAAQARVAQARQQSQRTLIRAPFDGVVSERAVSAGDTVQIGMALVKVIDPSSVRFEGLISADDASTVKVGQAVNFWTNGQQENRFSGKVRRVDPAANGVTRQVEVLVDFVGDKRPGVTGVYAEGRVDADTSSALIVPEVALLRQAGKAYAWRVKDGTLQKVSLEVGERDPRRGNYAVRSGLQSGDKLVRNPVPTLKEGQQVRFAAATEPATASAPLQRNP